MGSIPWNDLLPYVDFFKEIRGLFSDICWIEDWPKLLNELSILGSQ
jgi:hypothetical protein